MRRLVLADDSKTIQKIISLSLKVEEYEVECFDDGTSALENIRRRGADVVLADVSLPLLDGYELCRELKEDPRTALLPVILLAGSLEPIDEDRAEEVGSDGALTKPFDISQLEELVDSLKERQDEAASIPVPSEARVEEFDSSFLFELPVGRASGDLLFKLSAEECRPSFQVLERRLFRRQPIELSSLSEEDFNTLVDEVARRLPETLRQMLPDLARRVSEKPQA